MRNVYWMALGGCALLAGLSQTVPALETGPATTAAATRPATQPATQPAPIPVFKVGGKALALPAPTPDFVEIGNQGRPKFEFFGTAETRLIAGYVTPADKVQILKSAPDFEMSQYAMIQVFRKLEATDITPADYKAIVDDICRAATGKELEANVKLAQEDIRRRLKEINLEPVNIGKPVSLGTLFSGSDAMCVGIISVVKTRKANKQVAGAFGVVRVKERILMFQIYNDYKDATSVQWLTETGQQWVEAIQKANAQ